MSAQDKAQEAYNWALKQRDAALEVAQQRLEIIEALEVRLQAAEEMLVFAWEELIRPAYPPATEPTEKERRALLKYLGLVEPLLALVQGQQP